MADENAEKSQIAPGKIPAAIFNSASTPLRGALKLEASTSTPVVSAGTEFSIYVVIRNPFPVPVSIYGVDTHIPVSLSDARYDENRKKEVTKSRSERFAATKGVFRKLLLKVSFFFSDIFGALRAPEPGPRVATAVSPELEQASTSLQSYVQIASGDSSTITILKDLIARDQWNLSFEGMSPDEIQQSLWFINEYTQGRVPIVLLPGDSVVRHFVLKTTRWLFFNPISHTFQIQVKYIVDDQLHTDTVPFSINIRAAMMSSLIGAIGGSILGAIVSRHNTQAALDDWPRLLLTSVIFAVIIVVAFARKNSVQQIVSVEDFWGGVFIGFLVGYSGESFINSIIGSPK